MGRMKEYYFEILEQMYLAEEADMEENYEEGNEDIINAPAKTPQIQGHNKRLGRTLCEEGHSRPSSLFKKRAK